MKMLYLKRLESSAAAFETSITRQAQFQERFLASLRQGRLLDAASYRKLLAIEEDEERPERADDVLAQLPQVAPAEYDMDKIESLVRADVEALQTIVASVTQARDQGGSRGDDKLEQIKRLLAGGLRRRKVLIFASYHDTATYLHRELAADAAWWVEAGRPVLGLITGETRPDERKRTIERFAPNANRPPDDQGGLHWRPVGEEIQVLVSTDVLSEGQNLQDAGVILNYDLHWNPVRLIQRAGRVDRIGSQFEQIELYNVFPQAGLEELLGLVRRLAARIAAIDQTVGLDSSVLGEAISGRSLEQLRQLHRNDQQVLRDLERQAELVSTEDMKFPLLSYMQQIGETAVADIPLGIHSGKRYRAHAAQAGTFFAFRAGERHFWRFYPDNGSAPETHVRAIYQMIVCSAAEERVSPGPVPYDLIDKATQDVLIAIQGEQARIQTRAALTGVGQKLYNWLNRPTLWDGNASFDREQLERFNAVLEGVPLRPFDRDPALKRLVRTYEHEGSFVQLVEDLDGFFTENDLYQQGNADLQTMSAIKQEDLRLVCYERLALA